MTPEDIDRILADSGSRQSSADLRPAMQRAKAALGPSLEPVRPLAPASAFLPALVLVFVAVSALSAWGLGMHGLHVLSALQRALIFPVVFTCASLAAVAAVREMRPAGGHRIAATALSASILGLLAVFALLLGDYDRGRFVPEGIRCLIAGLACAIPAAFVITLLLRRGYVLDWQAAGLAAGTLAGLAGIAMLELHCPILKAPHVLFWHVAVVLVSGIAGRCLGWAAQSLKRT